MDKKRRKLCLERNDGQEAEIAALKQKLVHMEAELKMNKAEKEDLLQRVTSLEQDFAKKEAQLNLSEEKCRTLQESSDLAEQKLALFSQKPETVAEECLAQVDETNGDAVGIDSLPDEIIVEILGYLKQSQLRQIARVCRRWNELTKDPVLWKEVNVNFLSSHRYQTTVVKSFINRLPSCVTSITLYFALYGNWIEPLDFAELCVKLQEKCPHLEELTLTRAELSDSLHSVIDLCTQFLLDLKSLTFHSCTFLAYSPTVQFSGTSKIEVLDLFLCKFRLFNKLQFSRMPYLKVLRLHYTSVNDFFFHDNTSFFNQLHVLDVGCTRITASILTAIQNHGFNLKELYICRFNLQNHDLNFNNPVFPYLKTICLRCFGVTCENVVSLIQSCPSLENVYVRSDVAESYAVHPFVVANRCKSGIVKAIKLIHKHNVDPLHRWILF